MMLRLLPLMLAAQAVPAPMPAPLPSSVDGLPIGAIPRQDLPKTGCAAYLWKASGTPAMLAMAQAEPARLRLSVEGKITDLERVSQLGAGGFGFAETTDYGGGSITATLTFKIETHGELSGGAAVPQATLRLDRAGQDTIIVPVAGLIGCA